MSKRTISLIIALFIITLILLWIALSNNQVTPTKTSVTLSPTPTPYAQTSLMFSPTSISIPKGSAAPQTIAVMMTTGANNVTGVQLELAYDPHALTNVSVAQGNMFTNPLMFMNKVDTSNGRISYVYAITPSQKPQKGSGTVALITFTPIRNPLSATGHPITKTTLSFVPKTQATARGVDQSVVIPSSLQNAVTISFASTSATTTTIYTTPPVQKLSPTMK